jgi:hypothetical protein
MRGLTFPLEIEIVDTRESQEALAAAAYIPNGPKPEFPKPNSPYTVKAMLTVCGTSRQGASHVLLACLTISLLLLV